MDQEWKPAFKVCLTCYRASKGDCSPECLEELTTGACNSFDALLEACEGLIKDITWMGKELHIPKGSPNSLNKALQAIKQATK